MHKHSHPHANIISNTLKLTNLKESICCKVQFTPNIQISYTRIQEKNVLHVVLYCVASGNMSVSVFLVLKRCVLI